MRRPLRPASARRHAALAMMLAIAASVPGLLPGASPPARGPFVPHWTRGQTWHVESRHPTVRVEERAARAGERLSEPILWEYHVASTRDAGALRYFRLLARDSRGRNPSRAGLIFIGRIGAGGTLESLALARATFESVVRGKLTRWSVDYRKQSAGPHPVIASESLIPADMPCFGTAATAVTTFDVTEMQNGLPFAMDVTQTQKRLPPRGAGSFEERAVFRGPTEPIRLRVDATASESFDYLLARPADGALVHQIWNRAFPWFLYSRSHGGIHYLVPAETSAPRAR